MKEDALTVIASIKDAAADAVQGSTKSPAITVNAEKAKSSSPPAPVALVKPVLDKNQSPVAVLETADKDLPPLDIFENVDEPKSAIAIYDELDQEPTCELQEPVADQKSPIAK